MIVEFDPAKDAANVEKHGISLARAADLVPLSFVEDLRFGEPRYRLYGLIDGLPHCLAATDRGQAMRAISLRRAHAKEMRRYVR
ncbi:MAG: BrnT family toxin [Alphaproteobacteria bacterium]|nr:BrnT family toxin [Alphaproteobacteria bacterium]MBV9371153.1 BrnT family toxin [Alphaproteobacteria bacterium]MBV9901202.1 BrnT family toxin [Alphaproteobacteria bacterium]